MHPTTALWVFAAYACLLFCLAAWTNRKKQSQVAAESNDSGNRRFFLAGRNNAWYLVAFGMIGASLSGVTFMNIPGWVRDSSWSYLQMVIGYLAGYAFIMAVLMPLY